MRAVTGPPLRSLPARPLTRDEFNAAVMQLRQLSKSQAGEQSWALASRVIPVAAQYRTPVDIAALLIVAIVAYHAAVICTSAADAAAIFWDLLERRRQACAQGASAREVLGAPFHLPEKLYKYRLVLFDVAPPLLQSAFDVAISATTSLLSLPP